MPAKALIAGRRLPAAMGDAVRQERWPYPPDYVSAETLAYGRSNARGARAYRHHSSAVIDFGKDAPLRRLLAKSWRSTSMTQTHWVWDRRCRGHPRRARSGRYGLSPGRWTSTGQFRHDRKAAFEVGAREPFERRFHGRSRSASLCSLVLLTRCEEIHASRSARV